MTQSGIYEHFRGKLYFVLSGATHRDTPLDLDTSEVIYHPLYQAPRLEIGETGRETHLTIFEIIPNNSHTIATVRLKDCDGELVERSIIYLITYCIFSGMVVEI